MKVLFLILALAESCAAQTVSFLEWGDGCNPGLWLTISNTPPTWTLSWSTDLTNWTRYLTKETPNPTNWTQPRNIEFKVNTNDPVLFWKCVSLVTNYVGPIPRPPPIP